VREKRARKKRKERERCGGGEEQRNNNELSKCIGYEVVEGKSTVEGSRIGDYLDPLK